MPEPVYSKLLHTRSPFALIVLFAILTPTCVDASTDDSPARGSAPSRTRAIDLWHSGDRAGAIAEYHRLVEAGAATNDDRQSLTLLLLEQGAFGPLDSAPPHAAIGTLAAGQGELVGLNQLVEPAAAWVGPLWSGVSALDEGRLEDAERMLAAAIASSPAGHLPYAHYFRGRIAMARGDSGTAVEFFERALRQDPAITEAFLPMGRAMWELGRYAQARDRLRRARISRPWDSRITEQLRAWEAERPVSRENADRRAAQRRAAATPPRVQPPPSGDQQAPTVRVGLAEQLQSIWLKTGGPARVIVGDPSPPDAEFDAVAVLDRPETIQIRLIAGDIAVDTEGGASIYRGPGLVRFVYEDPTHTSMIFDLTFGSGQFRSGQEDRSYRGSIEFLRMNGRLTVVNEIRVDEYLYSVVPSEMPASWPRAALEAQAIAARSYTLYPRNRFTDRGFDLLSSVSSAYYPGVSNEHPRTTAAVDATQGLVLRDGARPLDAVYSANSAGYGEAAGSVWGWPNSLVATSDPLVPELNEPRSPAELWAWLSSRPDSYAARQPFSSMSAYRWIRVVPRVAIEARLAAAGIEVGLVKGLTARARGITGRVESVTVTGSAGSTEVRRDLIRSRLGGLRSNLFMVAPYPLGSDQPEAFVFLGAGWGHGVGMCQTGAAGMAADGYRAEEILEVYYPRNSVDEWY